MTWKTRGRGVAFKSLQVRAVSLKTGPEAGQYLHVSLALCMGYKTREEYMWKPQKYKRNLIRFVPFEARVPPNK